MGSVDCRKVEYGFPVERGVRQLTVNRVCQFSIKRPLSNNSKPQYTPINRCFIYVCHKQQVLIGCYVQPPIRTCFSLWRHTFLFLREARLNTE